MPWSPFTCTLGLATFMFQTNSELKTENPIRIHQTQRYKTVIDIGGGIQTIFKQTNNKFSLTLVLVFSID